MKRLRTAARKKGQDPAGILPPRPFFWRFCAPREKARREKKARSSCSAAAFLGSGKNPKNFGREGRPWEGDGVRSRVKRREKCVRCSRLRTLNGFERCCVEGYGQAFLLGPSRWGEVHCCGLPRRSHGSFNPSSLFFQQTTSIFDALQQH